MGAVESAVLNGTDLDVVDALLVKCARTVDGTDSGRDVKALSIAILDCLQLRRELREGEDEADAGPSLVDQFRLLCRGDADTASQC